MGDERTGLPEAPPSHFVSLAGGPVEYRVTGPSPAERQVRPVVLLHEGLGSLSTWHDMPERLTAATGRPVMAFSRHGYGRSGPARVPRSVNYMHDEALVVLPELLAALGLRAPILVGHSDGASIALIHAGTGHPVSGIVALAPHVMVETRTLDGIHVAREEYRYGRLRERLARHHDDPDAAFYGWNDIWLDRAFAGWSIEGHLPGVTTPLLCVQCADDPYGSLTQLDRIEAHVAGPVTRLVFPDGGHGPQRSHPAEVLHAISAFCRLLG